MPSPVDGSALPDLSETTATKSENPYDTLIDTCQNDARQIHQRYETHRRARNEQQKAILLSPTFSGFNLDPVLTRLIDQKSHADYVDSRHCLVFWARPPQRIRELVNHIQQMLLQSAPNLWLMPLECLHLTVLEIAHSRTEEDISKLVHIMESKIPEITDFTYNHRPRLQRPLVNYDTAAIALSFLPTANEESEASNPQTNAYTYHHLRRDIYSECASTGVEIASRYVVPSSHLTIARFVTQKGFEKHGGEGIDQQKVKEFVSTLDAINQTLEKDYWPVESSCWQVGEEKGLVCRRGTVWYGGGYSAHEGQGFPAPQS